MLRQGTRGRIRGEMADGEGTRLLRAGKAGTCLSGRLALFLALVASGLSSAWAQPTRLTSLHQIRSLANGQSSLGLPVEFQATVTYIRTYERALFVQDGDSAIYVDWPT